MTVAADDRYGDAPTGHVTRRALLERSVQLGASLTVPAVLAACGGGGNGSTKPTAALATGKPKRGGHLRTGHVGGGTSETLDPHQTVAYIDVARAVNLFDSLTVPRPDGTIAPMLALSMEPNANATVWQIKLRSGVTFHNGKPFTADDVLYTFQRIIKHKLVPATYLEPVDMGATKKVNAHEIRLVLNRPIGDLQRQFSSEALSIVQEGATDFKHPVGTGPFKFVSFNPGSESLFNRNPNYWVSGQPYVDNLQMISIPDSTARYNALVSGQIDLLDSLDLGQAKANLNSSSISVIRVKSNQSLPFYCRVDRAPFNDSRVRLAFKLAMNRPQMVESALLGFGAVGNDCWGRYTPSYDASIPQHSYDPEQAKSLLKQAGVPNPHVTLLTSTNHPGMLEGAEVYARQATASGINIKLHQVPPQDLYNPQLYFLKTTFGSAAWQHLTFEEQVLQSNLRNCPYWETRWAPAEFQKEFVRAQGIVDEAKRNDVYHQLERMQWAQGGDLIWGVEEVIDGASDKVRGLIPSPYGNLGRWNFKTVSLA